MSLQIYCQLFCHLISNVLARLCICVCLRACSSSPILRICKSVLAVSLYLLSKKSCYNSLSLCIVCFSKSTFGKLLIFNMKGYIPRWVPVIVDIKRSGIIILIMKLKRKLEFRGHVYFQAVRPELVENALNWLVRNNPL